MHIKWSSFLMALLSVLSVRNGYAQKVPAVVTKEAMTQAVERAVLKDATLAEVGQQVIAQEAARQAASTPIFPTVEQIHKYVEEGSLAPFPTVTANKVLIQRYNESLPPYMIPVENKHSISPQRGAFDGGKYPNVLTQQMMGMFRKAKQEAASEYITRNQRLQYAADVERLRVLYSKVQQAAPQNLEDLGFLSVHLVHSVPPETMVYIKNLYRDLVVQSAQVHDEITTWLIYAALPGEGKRISPQKSNRFNTLILSIQSKIKELSQHLDAPYLEEQSAYWTYMFGAINPVLKGLLASSFKEVRPDNRIFKEKQFSLHYLNGRSYLFPPEKFEYNGKTFTYPGSATLIVDPDEMLEKSIIEVRAEMNFVQQLAKRYEKERIERIARMPKNLRIAYINDDANPRANFNYWHKQGYLGEGATLAVFSTGTDFMQSVRQGAIYDLVITDLLVENGGMFMMPELRGLLPKATVIANSKYELESLDTQSLFNAGMDGYMWNNTNFDQGMIGYMEYLRAMNNYYDMRDKFGWSR